MATDVEVNAFLTDLETVFRKHNMILDSCGCCDSPWLVFSNPESIDKMMTHLKEQDPVKQEHIANGRAP
jgi:hypothetical protein